MFCIATTAVAVGALLAFVCRNTYYNAAGLVPIPWLMAVFGGTWENHHATIQRIGKYIASIMEPIAREAAGAYAAVLGWESGIRTPQAIFNVRIRAFLVRLGSCSGRGTAAGFGKQIIKPY